MAKKVPIKPGCLCIVKPGCSSLEGVLASGDIVTAVYYLGTVRGLDLGAQRASVAVHAWEVTNTRINRWLQQQTRHDCVAVEERYLQPISDPDQEPMLIAEEMIELANKLCGLPA